MAFSLKRERLESNFPTLEILDATAGSYRDRACINIAGEVFKRDAYMRQPVRRAPTRDLSARAVLFLHGCCRVALRGRCYIASFGHVSCVESRSAQDIGAGFLHIRASAVGRGFRSLHSSPSMRVACPASV